MSPCGNNSLQELSWSLRSGRGVHQAKRRIGKEHQVLGSQNQRDTAQCVHNGYHVQFALKRALNSAKILRSYSIDSFKLLTVSSNDSRARKPIGRFMRIVSFNHFHLVVETPGGNLVAGRRWFMSTCTARCNRRPKLCGHLFSGRYKALIVDGRGTGYRRTVRDYVPRHSVRAKLLWPEQKLRDFGRSSWIGCWANWAFPKTAPRAGNHWSTTGKPAAPKRTVMNSTVSGAAGVWATNNSARNGWKGLVRARANRTGRTRAVRRRNASE